MLYDDNDGQNDNMMVNCKYDNHMILLLKVVGARPPPVVTWWRDGRQLRGNVTAHVRHEIFINF